ncbi:MAG: hypothetical protein EAZ47_08790 [Bacteroidetes bacterium]|nr:MAG: hypothetical protein EAY72_01655 [Bacteroidota bacterium]TAF92368.1 MAG: hypothetical protein EAZ47_08790 [Bacteroidota bacterium]
MRYFTTRLVLAGFIGLLGCKTQAPQPTTVAYEGVKITTEAPKDSNVLKMLKPFSDSINKTMNKVIGFAVNNLAKKQPESNLGNLMTDCMLVQASATFGIQADAAFVNYGGIRSYIPKGEVTVGKVYELMPFDNLIVVQKLSGKVLLQFLQHITQRGTWPCSGIKYTVVNKQPTNIFIGGKPLDEAKDYYIVNTDYITSGGDDCDMLRPFPVMNKGYLFRDALISYFQLLTQQGKPIDAPIENRITINN